MTDVSPNGRGRTWRPTNSRRALAVGVALGACMVTFGMVRAAAEAPVIVAAIRTSPESRATYLAHATIWHEPGALSPTDILEGPPGAFRYTFEQATRDEAVACAFTEAGMHLGGHTEKFLCRAADGENLRLKYWDPHTHTGNREVFATVAASRLMWALGFEAIPSLPIDVRCDGCPANPMKGAGARRSRHYVAVWQPRWPPPILSSDSVDQGWSWLELDTAIRSLPPGPERARQRMYFDALTLLGVLMEHGDRKAEQQRLYCAAPIDSRAGDLRTVSGDTASTLLERPDASACPTAAVTIVDVGATFGGAGRASSDTTAKMNFDEWRRKLVFKDTGRGACRGDLTVSFNARRDGEPNPIISEQGRSFLVEQLRRLTTDHVRAIFRAARVDQLGDAPGTDPSARGDRAVDAWVAVFQDKVRQIEARHCSAAD
jgi:hypothetical protein